MAKVYLETSFFSACATVRTDAGSIFRRGVSRAWLDTQADRHSLYVCTEVLLELNDPAHRTRNEAYELARACGVVPVSDEVRGFARILVETHVMPGPVGGDAIHVAACCVHGIEYLLSWNVKHLANPNKLKHLGVVCRRHALNPPAIVTPELLWETEP